MMAGTGDISRHALARRLVLDDGRDGEGVVAGWAHIRTNGQRALSNSVDRTGSLLESGRQLFLGRGSSSRNCGLARTRAVLRRDGRLPWAGTSVDATD